MFCLRLAQVETVQFFQFDSDGNMYMFAPGAGCTGVAKLVKPGDEMIFSGESVENYQESQMSGSNVCDGASSELDVTVTSSKHRYNEPLKAEDLKDLKHKNFSEDTLKKIKWVTKMYREWRGHRNVGGIVIQCDLDKNETVSVATLNAAVPQFLSEVRKLNGASFLGRTLYDIVICIQFHLEINGFCFKLLNDERFREIKWSLDNLMKLRTAEGVGVSVRKAQILSQSEEEFLWSLGLLGSSNPEVLLNTVIFVIGKGFALRAGKEHQALRSPSFNSQFSFLHDDQGYWLIRYNEEIGFKTNKGGLKHRKVDP